MTTPHLSNQHFTPDIDCNHPPVKYQGVVLRPGCIDDNGVGMGQASFYRWDNHYFPPEPSVHPNNHRVTVYSSGDPRPHYTFYFSVPRNAGMSSYSITFTRGDQGDRDSPFDESTTIALRDGTKNLTRHTDRTIHGAGDLQGRDLLAIAGGVWMERCNGTYKMTVEWTDDSTNQLQKWDPEMEVNVINNE